METMNISLPETMKQFIDQEIKKGGYGTVSEYIRALLREEQKKRAQSKLDALLLEGLASGSPTQATKAYWDDIRKESRVRLKSKK